MFLIFLCGAAVGVVGTQAFLREHWGINPAAISTVEKARHVGLVNLRTKLNLTAQQERTISKILDDYGKFYQNIEDEREDVAGQGRRQILEALTPEQQKRFKELIGPTRH